MTRWIKDTSFGERLKFIRHCRGFTQKELGMLLGYPENQADVRIAQYEKNARTPKQKTVDQLVEILDVSPVVFSQKICSSSEELLQSMYWLFLVKNSDVIYESVNEFDKSKIKLMIGEFSPEKFLENMFTMQSPLC